ncbi:hypothetical protein OESDEN_04326 [Oesophagostomum dentatum]|uniref:Uncharacterized protein n=1 Tax=Oesophagostomum dentatum TaxID=61180 RepID=A0A0B1TK02_OESDE|nr:hypothetical protein OESDEN_04326 [Oesophagostomum dentatum]
MSNIHRVERCYTPRAITLIIVLLLVIAHVIRLVLGMQKAPKQETPSAIVIQPKQEEPKKEIKKKKKASLACKHRSNYNLPSKLMMVDIEVKKVTKEEAKKKKEKEMELENPIKNIAISAPPPYKAIKPTSEPAKPPEPTAPTPAKPEAPQQPQPDPAMSTAKSDKPNGDRDKKSGSTIVSTTLKSETNATPSTTGGKV